MSISEIHVGSLIRVKIGKNLILAKVVEILDGAVRVCSVANNKEFNVPQSRVQLDGEQPAPANEEPQVETTAENAEASVASDSTESEEPQTEQEAAEPEAVTQTEQESAEQEPQAEASVEVAEQEAVPVEPEQPEATVEAAEQEVSTSEVEQPEATVEAAEQEVATAETEPATVEVVPEAEAAEFTPSGEDEEDEYAINPAHESDKPVKRLSLLNAAVIVLKDAGPERPMNCKEILEAILARQLWTQTDCKTPEQTLYGSIFREINTKEHPRIKKSNVKGKFVIAE